MDEGHHLEEHNYTTPAEDEEVGVCLHVSKHRISLEFYSKMATYWNWRLASEGLAVLPSEPTLKVKQLQ
ncbi:hypothetical protein MTP99_015234 [Tenebrio molitor]|nr:hypothetical protein MTP99_015234 [Tenebrio molitor]